MDSQTPKGNYIKSGHLCGFIAAFCWFTGVLLAELVRYSIGPVCFVDRSVNALLALCAARSHELQSKALAWTSCVVSVLETGLRRWNEQSVVGIYVVFWSLLLSWYGICAPFSNCKQLSYVMFCQILGHILHGSLVRVSHLFTLTGGPAFQWRASE